MTDASRTNTRHFEHELHRRAQDIAKFLQRHNRDAVTVLRDGTVIWPIADPTPVSSEPSEA